MICNPIHSLEKVFPLKLQYKTIDDTKKKKRIKYKDIRVRFEINPYKNEEEKNKTRNSGSFSSSFSLNDK